MEMSSQLKGLRINRYAPSITFVDDLLLFGRSNKHSINKIKELLEDYGRWLDQQINLQKSSMHLCRNVHQEKKRRTTRIHGTSKHGENQKVPRIPTTPGPIKEELLSNFDTKKWTQNYQNGSPNQIIPSFYTGLPYGH